MGGPHIHLPRSSDPFVGRAVHFHPVCNPTRQPPHREQDREHLHGNADRSIDNAGVEVDVGIQLPLNKVRIVESDRFEFLSHLEQRIINRKLGEQFVACFFDGKGPFRTGDQCFGMVFIGFR